MTPATPVMRPRWQLGFAALAVMVASADTYVVVIALTAMMADLGLSITQLDRATPIISGFLVGYIAMLPLLGRLSDYRGRLSVLQLCLACFAAGSLVTATAPELTQVVLGRALQGLGGGGLVPVTLALVADQWPVERRGVPLGVVAGVQELGSLLGPLYGALILALAGWRLIFWLNLPVAAVLSLGLWWAGGLRLPRRRTLPLLALTLLACALAALVLVQPGLIANDAVFGALYAPLVAGVMATTPMSLALIGVLVILGAAVLWRLRPGQGAAAALGTADALGSLLLVAALGLVVVSFAAADPTTEIVASTWYITLPLAALAVALLVWHERRHPDPLIPLPALRHRAAVGAVVTNLLVGTALMAALVDVPLFARATTFTSLSPAAAQFQSALLLLRLLVAVPVGAVAGGVLSHRAGNRITAAAGLALCAGAFWAMGQWTPQTPVEPLLGLGAIHPSDVALVICGFGFGLAIAPVSAAILAVVAPAIHGLASALVVMARMLGMLVGLSLLTAIGLHSFYTSLSGHCDSALSCPDATIIDAVTSEIHAIFLGAAVAALAAAVVAAATLGRETPA